MMPFAHQLNVAQALSNEQPSARPSNTQALPDVAGYVAAAVPIDVAAGLEQPGSNCGGHQVVSDDRSMVVDGFSIEPLEPIDRVRNRHPSVHRVPLSNGYLVGNC